tara:strand:+ start:273 stop:545 length:273 start_codon:yes stop_codon:yes gene_type:complete
MNTIDLTNAELYADSSRGIHIPQFFAESHEPSSWDFSKCDKDSLLILKEGEEHELYWDAWCDVLNNVLTKDGGYLYQDGDLWVFPKGYDY